MRLDLQFFEQIAAMLKSDALANRDKRFEPRVGVRVRTKIFPTVVDDKGERSLDVWVRDVSAGGIGLASPRSLPRGSSFTIHLDGNDATDVTLHYKVTYLNALVGGSFLIGGAFEKVASTDEAWKKGPLRLLGKKKAKKSTGATGNATAA